MNIRDLIHLLSIRGIQQKKNLFVFFECLNRILVDLVMLFMLCVEIKIIYKYFFVRDYLIEFVTLQFKLDEIWYEGIFSDFILDKTNQGVFK